MTGPMFPAVDPSAYVSSQSEDACTPPLLRDGNLKALPNGFTVTCPTHQITWTVRVFQAWGGVTDRQWYQVAPAGSADPTQVRLASLEAKAVTVHRVLPTVAGVAVGTPLDVTVAWPTAFPDTAYTVEAVLPAVMTGKVSWAVKSKTSAGAVLTLTASAAVVTASVLDVTAVRYV